jgi:hypothetical protein
VLIEFVLQFCKIQKRSAQSVYFIDHHTIDTSCFNVSHQTLKRWAIHVAASKSNFVVVIWKTDPTFVLLANNECLSRFSLGVQRVEFELKPLFARLAGVDRAAVFRV